MPRFLTGLILVLAVLAAGCGLNESERAVADTNASIREVQEASQLVARRIAELPEANLTHESFSALRSALGEYMARVDTLNARIRELRGHFERLVPHIDETYRPAAEAAAQACQEAERALTDSASDEEAYRRAITRIGLCMDRYAAAVTNVANAYQDGR